jgi:hypothetical protein
MNDATTLEDLDYLMMTALRQRTDEAKARFVAAQQDMAILEYACDAFFAEMREKYNLATGEGFRDNGRIVRNRHDD